MNLDTTSSRRKRANSLQLSKLEEAFFKTPNPSGKVRSELATSLQMTDRSVQIWFQNRRAKVKQLHKKNFFNNSVTLSSTSLTIGSWRRVRLEQGDLTTSIEAGLVRWQIKEAQTCYRIEFQISNVYSISLVKNSAGLGQMTFHLSSHPLFFMQVNGAYSQCRDFTEESQASNVLSHIIVGDLRTLQGELSSLSKADPYLKNIITINAGVSTLGKRNSVDTLSTFTSLMNQFETNKSTTRRGSAPAAMFNPSPSFLAQFDQNFYGEFSPSLDSPMFSPLLEDLQLQTPQPSICDPSPLSKSLSLTPSLDKFNLMGMFDEYMDRTLTPDFKSFTPLVLDEYQIELAPLQTDGSPIVKEGNVEQFLNSADFDGIDYDFPGRTDVLKYSEQVQG